MAFALSVVAPIHEGRRFGGLERLYGVDGLHRIRSAHFAVVGIGGVGSWAAEALARSGVGRLTLIDLDHVSESNINRQIQATDTTVGMAKVVAMKQRIAQINPSCIVNGIEEFVSPESWPNLLPPSVNGLIDACDQMRAKVAMAQWALGAQLPFITVGAAGGKRLAHKVDIDDLANTSNDALLSQLRYNLRKHHGAARTGKRIGLMAVYSNEPASPAHASCGMVSDGTLNCHGYGSVVSVTATFGQCAAGWLLNQLAAESSAK